MLITKCYVLPRMKHKCSCLLKSFSAFSSSKTLNKDNNVQIKKNLLKQTFLYPIY